MSVPESPGQVPNETILVQGLTNREFLERYARPGRVGLSTGTALVDKAIARAQRHLDEHGRWGWWSHAFLFQGLRADGHHWLIESDLQLHRRHIHLGVQENRMQKYFDEATYTSLAVLDFGLTEEQCRAVVRGGLELVAARVRYSVRELFGVLLALRHSDLRAQENLLSRDQCFFCSAFVHHLFRGAGIDLLPGVDVKHTAPEDLARSTMPHTQYVLKRALPRAGCAACPSVSDDVFASGCEAFGGHRPPLPSPRGRRERALTDAFPMEAATHVVIGRRL